MKLLWTLVFSCLTFGLFAQVDLSKWARPVYDGEESTALSIFDANPESPDGKRLYFIRAADGQDKVEAVCIDLENAKIK